MKKLLLILTLFISANVFSQWTGVPSNYWFKKSLAVGTDSGFQVGPGSDIIKYMGVKPVNGSFLIGNGTHFVMESTTDIYFDLTNNRFSLGSSSPTEQLQITKNFRFPATTASLGVPTGGVFFRDGNRYWHNYGHANNLFIGLNSGNFTMSGGFGSNIGIGSNTLQSLTIGAQFNTVAGTNDGQFITTGVSNSFFGFQTGRNGNGSGNTAAGDGAMYGNSGTTASVKNNNSIFGRLSGYEMGAANNNSYFGAFSGQNNIVGHDNDYFGFQVGLNSTGSYGILIGNSIDAVGDYVLKIGNVYGGDLSTGIPKLPGTLTTNNTLTKVLAKNPSSTDMEEVDLSSFMTGSAGDEFQLQVANNAGGFAAYPWLAISPYDEDLVYMQDDAAETVGLYTDGLLGTGYYTNQGAYINGEGAATIQMAPNVFALTSKSSSGIVITMPDANADGYAVQLPLLGATDVGQYMAVSEFIPGDYDTIQLDWFDAPEAMTLSPGSGTHVGDDLTSIDIGGDLKATEIIDGLDLYGMQLDNLTYFSVGTGDINLDGTGQTVVAGNYVVLGAGDGHLKMTGVDVSSTSDSVLLTDGLNLTHYRMFTDLLNDRSTSDLPEGTNKYFTAEAAQDEAASLFTTDNGDIDFTYNDGTPDIAAQIKANAITNSDINSSAAIAYSKLNLALSVQNSDIVGMAWSKLTGTPTTLAGYGILDALSTSLASGKINVGNVSNVATAVTPTGDVTISNTGVTAIGSLKVLNSMINDVAFGKLTGLTAKQIQYGGSGGGMQGNSLFLFDDGNNAFSVGTTNANHFALHIANPTTQCKGVFTGEGSETQVKLRNSNGSAASPTASLSGDAIGVFGFAGYGATGFEGDVSGGFKGIASEDWSDIAHGTYLLWAVTPNGSTTLSKKLRLDQTGFLRVNGFNVPQYPLDVTGDANISSGSVYRINGTDLKTVAETYTNKSISGSTNTLTNIPVSALSLGMTATQTGTVTVTNTTTPTSLLSMTGTTTAAANEMTVGKTYEFMLEGYISTAAVAGNFTCVFKFGSTNFNTSGSTSLGTALANRQFKIEGVVTCRTTGASGTVWSQGSVQMNSSGTAIVNREMIQTVAGGATTINTTNSQVFDIVWTYSVADPGNVLVITNGYIRPIN